MISLNFLSSLNWIYRSWLLNFEGSPSEQNDDSNAESGDEIEEDISVEDLVTEINVEIKSKTLKEESPKRSKVIGNIEAKFLK